MIFFIIALGIGAVGALATYEFSPSAHKWIDVHVLHATDATVADAAADQHLEAGNLEAAAVSNQVGLAKTGQMAQTAKTPQQRTIAALMAELQLARQLEIMAAKSLEILIASHVPQQQQDAARVRREVARARVIDAKLALAKLGAPV